MIEKCHCRKWFNLKRGYHLKRDLWCCLCTLHLPTALVAYRGFGILMGKIFELATYIPFTRKTKQCLSFEVFQTEKAFFDKTTLLLHNGAVVLIIISFAKALFYITKQSCQLLRKFSSFLFQMIEREIISYFKCKVGMIKISV